MFHAVDILRNCPFSGSQWPAIENQGRGDHAQTQVTPNA
jgi:hypothetical protein